MKGGVGCMVLAAETLTATLARMGGIPTVAFGPPGIDSHGRSTAHAIDEHVSVNGLVACAQGLAVTAMRFCGVASSGTRRPPAR